MAFFFVFFLNLVHDHQLVQYNWLCVGFETVWTGSGQTTLFNIFSTLASQFFELHPLNFSDYANQNIWSFCGEFMMTKYGNYDFEFAIWAPDVRECPTS